MKLSIYKLLCVFSCLFSSFLFSGPSTIHKKKKKKASNQRAFFLSEMKSQKYDQKRAKQVKKPNKSKKRKENRARFGKKSTQGIEVSNYYSVLLGVAE